MTKRLLLEILGLAAFATGIGTLVTTAVVVASVLFNAVGLGPPPKGEQVFGTLLVFDGCLLVAFFLARYTRVLLR